MANTWGSLKWGEGNFGDQANVTQQVTGEQNNIALSHFRFQLHAENFMTHFLDLIY